jgi:O-antigen biosynthesis protein
VAADPGSQTNNRAIFARRFGLTVKRAVLDDGLQGTGLWRAKPLRLAFAVTQASDEAKAGDFFTALELADALRTKFGWEVVFVRHTVTQLPDVDVVVAMRHEFDLSNIAQASPGLIAVAWVRNRVEQWLAAPSFSGYHLVLCASQAGCEAIRAATGRECVLMPIATNESRFRPGVTRDGEAVDVVFTGNFWGVDREALNALDLNDVGGSFAIFGNGWEEQGRWPKYWRGALPYQDLPAVYDSAKIVLDDSHPVTRDWGMMNSRVFDALAAGSLVVTNCLGGSNELFAGQLPSFTDARQLRSLLQFYLTHEEERRALVAKLRQQVLEHHTYSRRADVIKSQLEGVANSIRIAIKVGIPNHDVKARWGDWHFACGLQRALQAYGARVRIDILPEWDCGLGVGDEVVIVLRGLSRYQPRPGALNLVWLISHPADVPEQELAEYNRVFVASRSYARRLAASLGDKVCELLQCTDPAVFHPADTIIPDLPTAIFVGNSRKVLRKVVDDAIAAGFDFAVCGGDWEHLIDKGHVLCDFIPNDELHRYYSSRPSSSTTIGQTCWSTVSFPTGCLMPARARPPSSPIR